ncbi:MAG: DUF4124 domain-containing protein [Methylovulum sp.]|nr:DUF4124 domain-containing protein [Methylovulum sp.]
MKRLLFILTSLFALDAAAEVYKCTDASGNKVYRSTPCAAGYNNIQIDLKTGITIDLDEEKKTELQRLKEQQEKQEQAQLKQQQEALRKQQIFNASKANQELIKASPHDFSAYAIPPYEPENLLPLVKRFEDRLVDIERLRGVAAKKALATGECNRVESSELNEKSGKDLLVFLVDCSNTKSFYFNEQELGK